ELRLAGAMPENEMSAHYQFWATTKEMLRNAILLDAKGVQTEGDAKRVEGILHKGRGSAKAMREAFVELKTMLTKSRDNANNLIANIYSNQNRSAPSSSRPSQSNSSSQSGTTKS